MSEARLILTCGLPGAGKTALARQLSADRSAVRLTKDEWLWALGSSPWDEPTREKVEHELWNLAQEVLRLGVSVIRPAPGEFDPGPEGRRDGFKRARVEFPHAVAGREDYLLSLFEPANVDALQTERGFEEKRRRISPTVSGERDSCSEYIQLRTL